MGEKYQITFQPQGITVQVPPDTTILEAALINNLPLEGPCNGKGTCGKCLVQVSGQLRDPSVDEKKKLGDKIHGGWRLACQAKVTGDVEVILNEKQIFHTIQAGKSKAYEFDPPFSKEIEGKEKGYGLAIDIGTTSIVASLIDLKRSGREVTTASCLNPQTQYGGDVLTRITYAHEKPENTPRLQFAVVSGINQLIDNICKEQALNPEDIYHLSIAANTTMLHLLLGIDPFPLAVAPYEPIFVDYKEVSASEVGIKAAPEAVISLLPSLSAFVGADILAGMIAMDYHNIKEPSLFIDIGTNGEIVANVNGKLVATSSAAGPALEGMNILYGCRAEDGAISRVKIEANGEVITESIGSAKHKGICGSGIVDLVAGLVESKVITSTGAFAPEETLPSLLAERVVEYEGQKAFLVDAPSGIIMTQRDIRQVQLAKAAIAAAIEILFQRLEISLGEVEKVYIAGAFGYHLKPEALRSIGLLPPGLKGQIEFVGNTAKEGARLCLTSKQALEEIQKMQQSITPIELSYAPEFMDNYIQQMDFAALVE